MQYGNRTRGVFEVNREETLEEKLRIKDWSKSIFNIDSMYSVFCFS